MKTNFLERIITRSKEYKISTEKVFMIYDNMSEL